MIRLSGVYCNQIIRLFGSTALTGQRKNQSQVIRLSGVYCSELNQVGPVSKVKFSPVQSSKFKGSRLVVVGWASADRITRHHPIDRLSLNPILNGLIGLQFTRIG